MKTNHLAVGPVDPVLLAGVDADLHHLLGHPLLHVAVVDHRVGEHHHLGTVGQSMAVNLNWDGSKTLAQVEGFNFETFWCKVFEGRKEGSTKLIHI